MKLRFAILIICLFSLMCSISFSKENKESKAINLPQIKLSPKKPLLNLLQERQSVRSFRTKQLSKEQISLILWAAAGTKLNSSMKLPIDSSDAVSSASRSVPSAGACHPIDVYLYVQNNGVKDLGAGFYQYLPQGHTLELLPVTIDNNKLIAACRNQSFIAESPVTVIITAVFKRTTKRYGQRGERYVYLDAGHVGQNIYLMAAQLSLATVEVGAFDDRRLADCLELEASTQPILVMPIGFASN